MRRVSLVKTWLGLYERPADALRRLNDALGTAYQHGHLSRWEREEREPAKAAREFMLREALPLVLKVAGSDAKKALEMLR